MNSELVFPTFGLASVTTMPTFSEKLTALKLGFLS